MVKQEAGRYARDVLAPYRQAADETGDHAAMDVMDYAEAAIGEDAQWQPERPRSIRSGLCMFVVGVVLGQALSSIPTPCRRPPRTMSRREIATR